MTKYLVGRIGQSLLLVLGVMVIVFSMLRVSGDPTNLLVPREATQEQREAAREAHGLNRTVAEQFVDFVGDSARLDFGSSLRYKIPVREVIFDRLPATIELGVVAMAFAVAVGVPLGNSGRRQGGRPLGWCGARVRPARPDDPKFLAVVGLHRGVRRQAWMVAVVRAQHDVDVVPHHS